MIHLYILLAHLSSMLEAVIGEECSEQIPTLQSRSSSCCCCSGWSSCCMRTMRIRIHEEWLLLSLLRACRGKRGKERHGIATGAAAAACNDSRCRHAAGNNSDRWRWKCLGWRRYGCNSTLGYSLSTRNVLAEFGPSLDKVLVLKATSIGAFSDPAPSVRIQLFGE